MSVNRIRKLEVHSRIPRTSPTAESVSFTDPYGNQVLVRQLHLPIIGKTDGAIASDHSGKVKIYSGVAGSEVYSGAEVDAWNAFADLADGVWVICEWINDQYYVVSGQGILVGKVKTSPIAAGGTGTAEIYTDATFATDAGFSLAVQDPRTTGSSLAVGHRIGIFKTGTIYCLIDLDPCTA
jgi:hypothetical protein